MSQTSDPSPPDISCTEFGFAEVEFPRLTQPRLVVGFVDGLQLLLSDPGDLDLAAEPIATLRLTRQRQEKGAIQ